MSYKYRQVSLMHSRRLLSTTLILASLIPSAVMAKRILVTYSSGTGFFINHDGYVLTNEHVVRDCRDITISGPGGQAPAVLVSHDRTYDLALLKSYASPPDIAYLSSMKQPLKKGAPVVIVGYPGQAWKTGNGVMRQARILNTRGPRGEEKWMEFTDVLEKGNSGGPLLDASGNVVGVVVAKGYAYTYDQTRQQVQDERFFDLAISLPVVRTFLEGSEATYHEADSGLYEQAQYMADKARRYIVNVRCKHGEQVLSDSTPR